MVRSPTLRDRDDMGYSDEDANDQFGRRIAGQLEGVLDQFYGFVDRMAERYGLDEYQRVEEVYRWCGEDLGEGYEVWINEDNERED